ncbi:MAG: bifunctional aspartate kinase/homoserine dehydrogenase I, partial [Paramuribaculum sp.]|nr:bifunctional aspartate kinase/homoserine dehydrogenase I [Paramuribaculum sp.]
SGDRILRIEAVLSGTLNFIFNELRKDIAFSQAVRGAMDAGYSEPDPRVDLSGTDVMRKLVILAREAGYHIDMEDIKINPLLPPELFEGSVDEFFAKVKELDPTFEDKRSAADKKGQRFRFVACLDKGAASVGLEAVSSEHPFYNLAGSNNVILITTERYHDYPMVIKGYGAGAEVTAAGVFADIISIANIR